MVADGRIVLGRRRQREVEHHGTHTGVRERLQGRRVLGTQCPGVRNIDGEDGHIIQASGPRVADTTP